MKTFIRASGVIGTLLFAAVFILSYADPVKLEKSARPFVQKELEKAVHAKLGLAKKAPTQKIMGLLSNTYKNEANRIKKLIEDEVPERVAAVVSQMLDPDCECRKELHSDIKASVKNILVGRINSLETARMQMDEIIKNGYIFIVKRLLLDLRIFSGTNAAAFLLVLGISFIQPGKQRHLMAPSVLLIMTTVACTAIYVFGQNWFHTIIFNNYTGYGYIAYMAVIFAFLSDILLNMGRLTNIAVNAIGGLFSC